MKTNKLFLALFAMTVIFESAFGQNGNAAISEVQVYDLGNGSGLVEVRVSGNNSGSVTGGYFLPLTSHARARAF